MTEVGVEKQGSLLKSIREWVPYVGARTGDKVEVIHGPLRRPLHTVGICEVRVRSSKESDVVTGLMVGEVLFTPQVRIQSMRVLSKKDVEGDI
jgi:hypothetical protein